MKKDGKQHAVVFIVLPKQSNYLKNPTTHIQKKSLNLLRQPKWYFSKFYKGTVHLPSLYSLAKKKKSMPLHKT